MTITVDNFSLEDTLLSGQCFRVTKEEDGSFTTILKDRVVNLKQNNNQIIIKSNNMKNIIEVIYNYFDLYTNYEKINDKLTKNDNIMKELVLKCNGYKVMNQDPFEMSISYIISQNNNVKRISSSVNRLCEMYGEEIIYDDKKYYLFPTYQRIKNITLEELRSIGIGFRDKYVMNFLESYEYNSNIDDLSTEDALKKLMKVNGIGLKVASCILLFGYKRKDVFPIDTWVKQFMSQKYKYDGNVDQIKEFATKRFGEYSGLAVQYMFHSQRNIK